MGQIPQRRCEVSDTWGSPACLGFWTVFRSCGNLCDSELQRFEAAVLRMKMTENRSSCSAESSWTHWVCSLSHVSKPMSMVHSLQLLHWNHCASHKKHKFYRSQLLLGLIEKLTLIQSADWGQSSAERLILFLFCFCDLIFLAALHQTGAFNEGFQLIHALIWNIIALSLLKSLLRWLQWNNPGVFRCVSSLSTRFVPSSRTRICSWWMLDFFRLSKCS